MKKSTTSGIMNHKELLSLSISGWLIVFAAQRRGASANLSTLRVRARKFFDAAACDREFSHRAAAIGRT
jgi:hypothetical protein